MSTPVKISRENYEMFLNGLVKMAVYEKALKMIPFAIDARNPNLTRSERIVLKIAETALDPK